MGTPHERRLALVVFVIGAGVMAVEMTASRLLAPYFGASMYVWTSLIVTVLIALSFGYYLGGNAAARGVDGESVGFLALLASLLLVAGVLIIPRFSTALSGLLNGMSSATIALFLGSLLVTIVVFALPVFLMAMAGPILLKEWSKDAADVGSAAGRYFAVSTAGSVIGTVAPSLILVPLFGARATMYAVSALFLLLSLLLLPKRRKLVLLVGVGIAAVMLSTPHRLPKGVVLERESPYQLIRVSQQDDGSRYLIFNEGSGIQSMYVPGGGRTGFYFDYAGVLPLLRPGTDTHRAAIIGLAGGSVASRYRSLSPGRNIEMVGVEVDQAVIDVARQYFDVGTTDIEVVNDDGRMWFDHTDEHFDVIVVDAYSTQLYIPPHLATVEFYAKAKSRLTPDGVLAMNVNAPSEESPLLKALANSVARSYKHVLVVPVGRTWNHLVLASDEPIELAAAAEAVPAGFEDVREALLSAYPVAYDSHAEIFTDDRAPIEFLTDAMILEQMWEPRS